MTQSVGSTRLVLSSRELPATPALEAAAKSLGWRVAYFDEGARSERRGVTTWYGGVGVARDAARRFGLALLEPPLDLLARLPERYVRRCVEATTLGRLGSFAEPVFLKPADPLDKSFDAGVYRELDQVRGQGRLGRDTPVLVSTPVEWLIEYRFFVAGGEVVAFSPYISFGRVTWKPFDARSQAPRPDPAALALVHALLRDRGVALPPASVVDVGLIEDVGWAVVEFNPVWCSGLLGAEPAPVARALPGVAKPAEMLADGERAWVLRRT
jgi:hypothetical protein